MRAGEPYRPRGGQHGIALLTVILIVMLVSSLALAVALITTFETRAAANFLAASQALRAADAGVELALPDLASTANWTAVLDGSSASTFTDGAAGPRTLADGRSIDLAEVVNLATCGHAAACTAAETCAVRDSRPWGPNNPRWRLYMSGALGSLAPGGLIPPSCYLVVLVADDPSETDGNPLQDGGTGQGAGAGTLLVRSEAFCPGGAHKVVEATVSRAAQQGLLASGVRLVVWREIREPGA
jgi:hypothetical protein